MSFEIPSSFKAVSLEQYGKPLVVKEIPMP